MSLKMIDLGTLTSAAAGTANQPTTTPFLPGTAVIAVLSTKTGAFSGTAKIQGSDDGSTYSDLATLTTTTGGQLLTEVVVKPYMRVNCTAFTSGSVTGTLLSA